MAYPVLLALPLLILAGSALGASTTASGAAPLDQLLRQFDADAPAAPGKVTLDAWIEEGAEGRSMVVLVQPEGETKLVADPGITVTPEDQGAVTWRSAVPHRMVDPTQTYLPPPAAIRMPFEAEEDQPIRVLVQYAYCVVDYQCFFGEERLSVANRIE